MKKNKDIKLVDSVNYMNSLFNELANNKISFYAMNRPFINEKFEVMLPGDVEEKRRKIEKFENFIWDEYERLAEELRELEYEKK